MPEKPPGPRPPSALALPCAPPDKRVLERLHEPVPEEAEFRILYGRPCILFQGWDYAEDWSGTFVEVIAHETLREAQAVSAAEFWILVREVQAARTSLSSSPPPREKPPT